MGRTMELDLRLPSAGDGWSARTPPSGPGPGRGRRTRRGATRSATDGLWPLECTAVPAPRGAGDADTAEAAVPAPAGTGTGTGTEGAVPAGQGAAGAVSPVPPAPSAGGPVRRGSAAASPGAASRRAAPRGTAGRAATAPPARDALALLRQAADQLAEAHREPEPVRRYPAAYLAALRAGAAVLAMRARPRPRRGAPRDVWRLLAEVAPELEEWAVFFASCSRTRAAAEAGIDRLVDRRGADDLLRQAEQFVARVQLLLPR